MEIPGNSSVESARLYSALSLFRLPLLVVGALALLMASYTGKGVGRLVLPSVRKYTAYTCRYV